MSRRQEHKIELTNDQRTQLRRIACSESKKLSQATKKRARVILHLDELGENPLTPAMAALKCKLHRETIYDIRRQFVLCGLEAAIYRKKCEVPPVPPKATGDIEARIIATACSAPPAGKAKWTVSMIANKIVLDGMVESIGDTTVRRTLKKQNINLI